MNLKVPIMSNIKIVSIDLAKNVFQVCAVNCEGKIAFNKKMNRRSVIDYLSNLTSVTVVMEACYSSNAWGRKILGFGHNVKLIPPFQVKPFVTGNKNDANDAVAIYEASQRPKASFVSVKTLDQQDVQTLLRLRERLMKHRTATINQTRGLLSEYGIVINKGRKPFLDFLQQMHDEGISDLTPVCQKCILINYQQVISISDEIEIINQDLVTLCQQHPYFKYLQTIPGIGPITAALLIASVGDPHYFKNGRQLAAWMGLTPKQHASGETSRMLGMSKRGNQQLRKALIHGARTVMNWSGKKMTS